MVILTELLKKFTLEDVPISEKLIAAKILFIRSEFCYVSRKEEAILEWLLELCNHDVSSDILNEVWHTLQNCLESETMNHIKVVDINSETKENLVKLLIRSLDSQVHGLPSKKNPRSCNMREESLPRECSVLILENTVFLYYFQKNLDSYVSLSQLLLKSAEESGDVKVFSRYMKSVVSFCDQCQNSNKIFIQKLLLPIVETFCSMKKMMNPISSCDHKLKVDIPSIDNTAKHIEEDTLKSQLLNLIQRVIFPSFVQKNLKNGLEHLFEKKIQDSSVLHILIQFLVKNVSCQEEVLSILYACVFEAFVIVFKNDFNVIFRFFIILCALLGLEIKIIKDEENKEMCLLSKDDVSEALAKKMPVPEVQVLLLVLKEIIAVLKNADLHLDETINEISFMKWFQGLVIQLSASFGTLPEVYSIMTIIIELSPLIFAPIINRVLINEFVKHKTTQEEKKQYKIFFLAMFNSLLKIHPLQSFIRNNLLPSLKQAIEERRLKESAIIDMTISDILPDGFITAYSKVVETISDGGHRLFLEVLENLLVPFLGGIRVAEQTVLKETYAKFLTNFLELQTCLGRFCTALLHYKHCSKSLASFLHLCFAVGELRLLLLLYSPWSKQDEHLQIESSANLGSDAEQMHLLSFLSFQQWNDIRQRAVELGDEACQKSLEYFLEVGRKINGAVEDFLQNAEMEKISFNSSKLLRYLELLRCLPLPFLPQETQTFVALGVLGVYVVLSEFSVECSNEIQNQAEEGSYASHSQIISIKNLCRELLLGLLDGPSPVSFLGLVDIGLVVQLMHRDGQCPKLLLELLFEDCIKKPEHLQKVVEAVCVVDEHVITHVNIDTTPISTLLLQLLRKFSVLENPDMYQDAVPMAENLLEVVTSSHKKIKNDLPGNVLWKTYKSLNRPQLVARLLKKAAVSDFERVLKDLCQSLKPSDGQPKEFPDLRLPTSLATMPMEAAKAVSIEKMMVRISSVAFSKVMQGDSDDKLPELLAFLLAIAKRSKVSLPFELADVILRTSVCALNVPSMSRELAMSTSTAVIQLLSKMVVHHFALLSDRIPSFMQVYRMAVHTVVISSAVELQLTNEEAEKCCRCALEIEQLSKSLSQHSLDFKAVSQHLVAGMLQELEETTIHHKVKFHIMNSLYALMDLCDRFAFAHLNQALAPTSLELFKTVRSNYKKFYRYTGKV
ncbi:Unhealthy ribosome biogenesis protein 2-like protein [Gryllus bimaculatus]|nr:Unhealthy ribosome biogenesis protein 2-like protein [Gryllus bimaculatus]